MVGYPAVACAILNYKLAITDFMKLMIPLFYGDHSWSGALRDPPSVEAQDGRYGTTVSRTPSRTSSRTAEAVVGGVVDR